MVADEDFSLVERPVPEPEEGEILVRNLWLSFDPTQRGWMSRDTYVPMVPLGEVMRDAGVGQVVATRRSDYRVGELVQGFLAGRTM
jgi:NADPH-dependent curcumin reductase CurA